MHFRWSQKINEMCAILSGFQEIEKKNWFELENAVELCDVIHGLLWNDNAEVSKVEIASGTIAKKSVYQITFDLIIRRIMMMRIFTE